MLKNFVTFFKTRSHLNICLERLQETHMNFIISTANLRAFVYNLKGKSWVYSEHKGNYALKPYGISRLLPGVLFHYKNSSTVGCHDDDGVRYSVTNMSRY